MLEIPSQEKVAVVTSDFKKLSFIKKALKDVYQLLQFKDEESLTDWLVKNEAKIIILDLKLSAEPMKKFCDNVKKNKGSETTPILLITNKIQKKFVLEALSAGISDFIHEPLIEYEIFERVSVAQRSKFINKKVSFVSSKIKPSKTSSKGSRVFLQRLLLSDNSLKAISKAKKMAIPLSVLIIQIDKYAELKDFFTLTTLEQISAIVEEEIKKKLKPNDTLICQGQGSYLLMLPKIPLVSAKIVAESVRKEIFNTSLDSEKGQIHISISIGIICFDKSFNDAAHAYELFDQSIERVKHSLESSQKKGNKIIFDTP